MDDLLGGAVRLDDVGLVHGPLVYLTLHGSGPAVMTPTALLDDNLVMQQDASVLVG